MKLTWQATDDPFIEYVSQGDEYAYQVSIKVTGLDTTYEVAQLRQKGGQIINRTHTVALEGAFARAQSWENG